jgi:hypothetical protein
MDDGTARQHPCSWPTGRPKPQGYGRQSAGSQRAVTSSFTCSSPVIRGACNRVVDSEVAGQEEAEARLAAALPSLTAAAGRAVSGEVGDADPMAAVQTR